MIHMEWEAIITTNKAGKEIIDMTEHGDAWDESNGGYQNCTDALTSILGEVYPRENAKKELFRVLVSKINRKDENNPYRYSRERIVTLKKLMNEWKLAKREVFSEEAYAKYLEQKWRDQDYQERQGASRAAWWAFVAYGNHIKLIEDEQKFQKKIDNMDYKEREEAIERRKEKQRSWSTQLYIG